MIAQHSLFGLSGSYRVRNGDVLLTTKARTALPFIAALERYRATHAGYPDPRRADDKAALIVYLPATSKVLRTGNWLEFDRGTQPHWTYSPTGINQQGYSLSIKLGWDPRLIYRRDQHSAEWIFDPGDGSEEKVVALRP